MKQVAEPTMAETIGQSMTPRDPKLLVSLTALSDELMNPFIDTPCHPHVFIWTDFKLVVIQLC